MRVEIEKIFWFCPCCGNTATPYKDPIPYIKELHCLTWGAVTEIKRCYVEEINNHVE